MVNLVEGFGFRLARVSGSHHIFRHGLTGTKLNLQPYRGQAKPYQIDQFLGLVEQLNLTMDAEDEE
ncbi:MAG: type II toxin-antitoxin system HicA family toxin [Chloroflexota bacterium]|nr:type II toxin-antitoxin system HicA family toxin [Chloroflexota bacterium]